MEMCENHLLPQPERIDYAKLTKSPRKMTMIRLTTAKGGRSEKGSRGSNKGKEELLCQIEASKLFHACD
eukprot:scaffold32052_cov169-Amphora_coffeaeformis.AAC.1